MLALSFFLTDDESSDIVKVNLGSSRGTQKYWRGV